MKNKKLRKSMMHRSCIHMLTWSTNYAWTQTLRQTAKCVCVVRDFLGGKIWIQLRDSSISVIWSKIQFFIRSYPQFHPYISLCLEKSKALKTRHTVLSTVSIPYTCIPIIICVVCFFAGQHLWSHSPCLLPDVVHMYHITVAV